MPYTYTISVPFIYYDSVFYGLFLLVFAFFIAFWIYKLVLSVVVGG